MHVSLAETDVSVLISLDRLPIACSLEVLAVFLDRSAGQPESCTSH